MDFLGKTSGHVGCSALTRHPTARSNMRVRLKLCLVFFLLVWGVGPITEAQTPNTAPVLVLRNNDILQMVADGVSSSEIVHRIETSSCNFDIFPPVLRDLRRRGVPEVVLATMQAVPVGPPARQSKEVPESLIAEVSIPSGATIEVESVVPTSSGKAQVGSPINFVVTKRVFVDNVLVIERGAVARGRVTKVKRASALGRAGMLAWEADFVTAVDGTRIPIQLTGEQRGANRSAVMAGGAAATAALIFPYSSPVALIWGLKKGDEAILRGSKVFFATLSSETRIAGIRPRQGGVVYRDRETVKASAAPPTNTSFPRRSVKAGG
jgi:hypothetical protein